MATLDELILMLDQIAYYVLDLTDATMKEKMKLLDEIIMFKDIIETIKEGKEDEDEY